MKLNQAFVAIALLTLSSLALADRGGPERGDPGRRGPEHGGPRRPEPRPEPRLEWQPVYRFFSGRNHFQTLSYEEGINARFSYEGISFYVLPRPYLGTVGLYRCIVPGSMDHFVSKDAGCEGQRTEGIYGYIFQRANRNAGLAIYRCYRNGDHLSTTNVNECYSAGYSVDGIAGYTAE